MPEDPSWPDGEVTEAELGGVAALTRSAMLSPDPPPLAEEKSYDQALALFREAAPLPRDLRQAPEPAPWTGRISRLLGRFFRK